MKLKHIATVMDALVGLIQKDDFPLTELILAENKLKNDIHDFINALGSNQSLQKLGEYIQCFYPSIHPHTSRRIRTFLPVIWLELQALPPNGSRQIDGKKLFHLHQRECVAIYIEKET